MESCSTKKVGGRHDHRRDDRLGKTVERTGVIINARHVLLFETRLDTPTNTYPTPNSLLVVISCKLFWPTSLRLNFLRSPSISISSTPLNLRLSKRRELWLISPFYGWNMILGSIFFFFFFLDLLETWLNKRRELWSSLCLLWDRYLYIYIFEIVPLDGRRRWSILRKNWDKILD